MNPGDTPTIPLIPSLALAAMAGVLVGLDAGGSKKPFMTVPDKDDGERKTAGIVPGPGGRTRYAELLIDGILGVGFKSMEFALYATDRGFADCAGGGQGDVRWTWKRDRLEQCSEEELLSIYVQAKGAGA